MAGAGWLSDQLAYGGLKTDCLHGNRPQEEREAVMAAFSQGEVDVMVATDLAGPHTLSLSSINLTLPLSHTHIHSLSFVLVAVMKPKELKTKISHAHSLILSLKHSLSLKHNPHNVVRRLGLDIYRSTSHSHSHTLTITCTCCYYEIKGTQDLTIYSHADSQILSLSLSGSFSLRIVVSGQ